MSEPTTLSRPLVGARRHPSLVSTPAAARAFSIPEALLTRGARDGTLTPAARTAGGHWRWDLEDAC